MTTDYDWRQDPFAPEQAELITNMKRTIAFDFDGTIHPYEEGWCGSAPTDVPPIPGTEKVLEALTDEGYRIIIFSCRADHVEGCQGIWDWIRKYDLARFVDDVVADKPKATAYVDDRAVAFRPRALGTTVAWADVLSRISEIAAYDGHGSAQ